LKLRRLTTSLLLALTLPACQPGAAPPRAKASTVPTHSAASEAPAAAAPDLLVAPAGDNRALSGTIALDATNLVATGGGNVISNDGSSLVAQGGGNLLVEAGNAVISNDGSSLISQDGAGLITNDGGSLITNDGGSFRLMQAPSAALTPVGGMEIRMFRLDTGEPLALGKDKAGKDVMAIASNRRGDFKVFLPADLDANVLIRATSANGKQVFQVLARPGQEGRVVDEDTVMATTALIEAYAGKLERLLVGGPEGIYAIIDEGKRVPTELLDKLRPLVKTAEDVDLAHWPAADRHRVLQQLVAKAISVLPFDTMDFSYGDEPGDDELRARGGSTNALGVIAEVMRELRTSLTPRLATPGALERLDRLPELVAFRKLRGVAEPIRYASDFNRFWIRAYVGNELIHPDILKFKLLDLLLEGLPLEEKYNDKLHGDVVGLMPTAGTTATLGFAREGQRLGYGRRVYLGTFRLVAELVSLLLLPDTEKALVPELTALIVKADAKRKK
jgi:hypothetical protein